MNLDFKFVLFLEERRFFFPNGRQHDPENDKFVSYYLQLNKVNTCIFNDKEMIFSSLYFSIKRKLRFIKNQVPSAQYQHQLKSHARISLNRNFTAV